MATPFVCLYGTQRCSSCCPAAACACCSSCATPSTTSVLPLVKESPHSCCNPGCCVSANTCSQTTSSRHVVRSESTLVQQGSPVVDTAPVKWSCAMAPQTACAATCMLVGHKHGRSIQVKARQHYKLAAPSSKPVTTSPSAHLSCWWEAGLLMLMHHECRVARLRGCRAGAVQPAGVACTPVTSLVTAIKPCTLHNTWPCQHTGRTAHNAPGCSQQQA